MCADNSNGSLANLTGKAEFDAVNSYIRFPFFESQAHALNFVSDDEVTEHLEIASDELSDPKLKARMQKDVALFILSTAQNNIVQRFESFDEDYLRVLWIENGESFSDFKTWVYKIPAELRIWRKRNPERATVGEFSLATLMGDGVRDEFLEVLAQ